MYDIIGDIHSCYDEFCELLLKLGYEWDSNESLFFSPNRKAVLVGDITDRGPQPTETFQLINNMFEAGHLMMVVGNHDDKLYRWSKGNNVELTNGLDATIKEVERVGIPRKKIFDFLGCLPYFLILDQGKLVVVHAAWKDKYVDADPHSRKIRSWVIYGPTTGKFVDGFPERVDWAVMRQQTKPMVVHGHQPVKEVRVVNNVYNIDTGCVFGGRLTALRYPENEIVSVKAKATFCYKNKWGYE
jgi:protein phosphatase